MKTSFCWQTVHLHPGDEGLWMVERACETERAVTATISTAPKEMLKGPQPRMYVLHLLQELQLGELLL